MENEFVKKEESEVVDETENTQQKKSERKFRSSAERKSSRAVAQILNGEFLTKEFVLNNLNFIFFIIFLLLLIVGKGYYGKQLSKDLETTQKELDEATAEYIEAKAKLEEDTRRQVLVEKLESRGLKETVNPTKVIRIKKVEN
jgi:hypothetical protein